MTGNNGKESEVFISYSGNCSEGKREMRGAICISFEFCQHDGERWEVVGGSEFVGIFHASINV